MYSKATFYTGNISFFSNGNRSERIKSEGDIKIEGPNRSSSGQKCALVMNDNLPVVEGILHLASTNMLFFFEPLSY